MPFIAPALPFIVGGLGAAGAVAKGREQGRQAQAQQNLSQDELRLRAANEALQEARFNREAPVVRAHHAVRGDILANAQPAGFTGSGRDLQFTGGLSPALFSAGTRDLGRAMTREAVLSGLRGQQPASGPEAAAVPRGGGFMGHVIGTAANKAIAAGLVPNAPLSDADAYTFHAPFSPTPLPSPGLLDKVLLGGGYAGGALGAYAQAGGRFGGPGGPLYRGPYDNPDLVGSD